MDCTYSYSASPQYGQKNNAERKARHEQGRRQRAYVRACYTYACAEIALKQKDNVLCVFERIVLCRCERIESQLKHTHTWVTIDPTFLVRIKIDPEHARCGGSDGFIHIYRSFEPIELWSWCTIDKWIIWVFVLVVPFSGT